MELNLPVAIVIGVAASLVFAAIYGLTTDRCPGCGWRNRKGAAACRHCHRRFDGQQPGAPSQAPLQSSPLGSPSPGPAAASGYQVPPTAVPRRRRRRGCLLVGLLALLVSAVGGGALLISAGALERLKPVEGVTFDTLDQYATGRLVTLTGGLALSEPYTCYNDGNDCGAELVDAADTTVAPGHPRTVFIYFDRSTLEPGARVHVTSGGLAETGAVVRVTGRVCRTTAEPPEACVRVEQVEPVGGSLAGASPRAPEPSETPTPTPQPTPTPDPADELAAACDGAPVPWAAAYSGKVHPLVVIDSDGIPTSYGINKSWRNGTWTSPIQLVVCVPDPAEASVKVGSCGRWQRESDKVGGELLQYRYKSTIRVVLAKTGKTLQRKALYGSFPPCGDAPEDQWSIPDMGDDPPWHLYGIEVTPAQVNAYAIEVSKQPVK